MSLPKGWVRTSLGELLAPRSDRVDPATCRDAKYIGLEHVEPQTSKILATVEAGQMSSSAARFAAGDVLYGRMRPYLNKVVRPAFRGLASAEFIVLPPNEAIDGHFLLRRLSAADFVEFACGQYEGDRPRVKFEQLASFPIALPPRSEQGRIGVTLAELLADLDTACAELELARRKLALYRQSLLKSAVEGALTAEWRDQQSQSASAEPEGDREGWAEIPHTWRWSLAASHCGFITKGTTPPKSRTGEAPRTVPFLRVTNLTHDGSLNFSDQVFVAEDVHRRLLARSIVKPGDVLMNIVGPPLGQVSLVPSTFPEWNVNQAIAIFRVEPGLLNEFLAYVLLSPGAGRWLQARAKTTAGQTNLTLEVCRALPVPVPPLGEQAEIVRLLNQQLDALAEQGKVVGQALAMAAAQRQNILRAAFSGQLVPQDPNDEPASVLLERIRAQRQAAVPAAKRKPGRPAKAIA